MVSFGYPIEAPRLDDFLKKGKKIVVLANDYTRMECPDREFLLVLYDEFKKIGINKYLSPIFPLPDMWHHFDLKRFEITIFSFFILALSVDGFMSRISAAPSLPSIFPIVYSRTSKIWFVII